MTWEYLSGAFRSPWTSSQFCLPPQVLTTMFCSCGFLPGAPALKGVWVSEALTGFCLLSLCHLQIHRTIIHGLDASLKFTFSLSFSRAAGCGLRAVSCNLGRFQQYFHHPHSSSCPPQTSSELCSPNVAIFFLQLCSAPACFPPLSLHFGVQHSALILLPPMYFHMSFTMRFFLKVMQALQLHVFSKYSKWSGWNVFPYRPGVQWVNSAVFSH